MTKQERNEQLNGWFKRPVVGRITAALLLLTLPISIPLILIFEAIANGGLMHIIVLWEIIRRDDKEKSND